MSALFSYLSLSFFLSQPHQRSPSFLLLSSLASHCVSSKYFLFRSHCLQNPCQRFLYPLLYPLIYFLEFLQFVSPLVGFNSVEEKGNCCCLCPSFSSSTQPTINCHPAYLSIFSGLTRAGHRVDPPPHKRELRQQCGPQTAAKFSLTAPILPKRPQKGSNLFCQT